MCIAQTSFQICCYRPQKSWGKVMFLHVSVILFTGGGCLGPGPGGSLGGSGWGVLGPDPKGEVGGSAGGWCQGPHIRGCRGPLWGATQAQAWGCIPACTDTNTPTPPPADGYCCRRYAFYWNAFPPPADGYCCRRYAFYWNAFLCEFINTLKSLFLLLCRVL